MFKKGDIVRGIHSNNNYYSDITIGKVISISEQEDVLVLEILEHRDSSNNNTIIEINNFNDYIEIFNDYIEKDDVLNLIFNYDPYKKKEYSNQIFNLIARISILKQNISTHIKEINTTIKDIDKLKIESFNYENISNKLVKELNLIQNDEKCDVVEINGDSINIITNQIYIEDKEHPEGLFKMNKYNIYINLKNLSIEILGVLEDYNRKSCWSDECPHPHISHRGDPCWGNTQAMLVDTMVDKELYSTFMIIINFLETFNLEDEAGKYISSWDFVSKKDKVTILKNPYSDYVEEHYEDEEYEEYCEECYDYVEPGDAWICNECDKFMCESCRYICSNCGDTICDTHSTYIYREKRHICNTCLDKYYVYSIEIDDYTHKNKANQCCHCEEYFESSLTATEDGNVCIDCLEEKYVYLEDANKYINSNNVD